MAKSKKDDTNTRKSTQKKENKKGSGVIFSILMILLIALIITVVLGGTFFIIIKKNVNGIAEKFREDIQSIPVLRLALPVPPDPEDPKYMTEEQIKLKYVEYRDMAKKNQEEIDNSVERIRELETSLEEKDKTIQKFEQQKQEILQERTKLEEDIKKFNEMVVNEDKSGFAEFFEKIDRETAERLYKEILEQQKADEDARRFVQLYENMEPESAAAIFEQMGDSQMDLIIDILKTMKQKTASEILESMEISFASKVSEKLSEAYMPNKVNEE
ncbi:MAG: MotE family protein [Acetivibrionales bacterium]|jgi:flagellar motility protein MotE (MotC chaperone)